MKNKSPEDKTKSKLYSYGQIHIDIFPCQLRNFSRNLNADLLKHNLTDSAKCCKCGYSCEGSVHFFSMSML